MRKRLIEVDEEEFQMLTAVLRNETTRLRETGLRVFSRDELAEHVDSMEKLSMTVADTTSFIE